MKLSPRVVGIAICALAIDQFSKWLIVFGLGLRETRELDVFPPFLRFRMAWNEGINFGLFSDGSQMLRWILIVVSIAATVLILSWSRRFEGWLGPVFAGCLVGGILGNGADRIVHGAVADFLNMSCCGVSNPFSFNLADVFIFSGAFGVILFQQRFAVRSGRGLNESRSD